jgi:hypothetical protein
VTTVEKLATAEELQAIEDPVERLRRAAEVTRQAEELAEPHRTRRNEAALQLYAELGGDANRGAAVEVWRDTCDISRNLWTRLLKSAAAGKVRAGAFADARQVAAEEARITAGFDALHKAAKDIRNATARHLMNARGMSNAEVGRIAGFTAARATQLRTSHTRVHASH